MSTEAPHKERFLVIVDEDRRGYLDEVFHGYDWVRVIRLDRDEYPVPAGKRLVSDAAWEVLRQGARIPLTEINQSLEMLGTEHLSRDQMLNSEKWCLAELCRRQSEEVDFDE